MTLGVLEFAPDACVSEILAARAAATPDAVAVVLGDQELSYRELDERANQLGRHLRDLGVGPDAVVGLYLERGVDMIVGLLAILKAGGAYLPLDANLPAERLSLILGSAKPRVTVTQKALASRATDGGSVAVCVDSERDVIAAHRPDGFDSGAYPGNLAYVIYTSGSTGVPKGIMIDHRALRDRVLAKAVRYGFRADDRVLQFTALSFDAAAAEIYPALLAGAALVVHATPSWTSPHELMDECERRGVTAVMLPPVYLQLLVDTLASSGRPIPWLRVFITGGESIPVERLAAWARLVPHGPRFVYAYGPTETTIAATLYVAPTDPAEIERLDKIPIGYPMPHTGVHVLDEWLRPVPVGEVGELWITGTGLARGYVGDPALTAERFRPSPFSATPGARMYRTGDLVRAVADGGLEFVGRVDAQVKVRGFRVDLGDVEAALAAHPDVGHAVVLCRDGRLVAYAVPRPQTRLVARELRAFVGRKLPEYMVPSAVVPLGALPLLPGGKIDIHALPAPRGEQSDPELAGGEPTSPIETLLSQIWRDLLQCERVGVDEDFFAAGGDSLLASQVVSRVRDALGVELPLRSVFQTPTVAGLADAITALSVAAGETDDMADLLSDIEGLSEDDVLARLRAEEPRP